MFSQTPNFAVPRPPGRLLKLLGTEVVDNRASTVFHAPIWLVWAAWNDQTAWNHQMASVRNLTPGPLAPGSYFEARVRGLPGGIQTRQVEQVVELEAPYRRTIRGVRWACVYEVGTVLSEHADGTRCECWSVTTLYGPLRLSAGIARRIGQRGLEQALELVGRHLASDAASSGARRERPAGARDSGATA